MIVLNKLAVQALENAQNSERVSEGSSPRAYLLQTTVHLGEVYQRTNFKDERLPQWSEYEVAAADTLTWLVAYLQKIGCRDIERLIKDVIAYRTEHPDRIRRKQ